MQVRCLRRPSYKVSILLDTAYYMVSFSFTTTVPRYLLLSVGGRAHPMCRAIFERILPTTESDNFTDADLIKSLFGNQQNSAFVSISTTDKSMSTMRGKFCSTASREWLLFTTFDDGNPHSFVMNQKKSLISLSLSQISEVYRSRWKCFKITNRRKGR